MADAERAVREQRKIDFGGENVPRNGVAYSCAPVDMDKFNGKNCLCCGGRAVMGPNLEYLAVSIALASTPTFCFAFGEWSWCNDHLSVVVCIIPLLFYAFIMANLFCAAMVDPGIIPKNKSCPQDTQPPKFIKVVDGVQYKWCRTCFIYRPPRAKHCPICDNCVDKFDHHCPWVGTCIARRNYRFFLNFILAVFVHAIYTFVMSIVILTIESGLASQGDGLMGAMRDRWGAMVGLVIGFIALLPVGGLAAYHLYLVSINQTTNEEVNEVFKRTQNPYTRGLRYNFVEAFWAPQRISKLLPDEQIGKMMASNQIPSQDPSIFENSI